VELLFAELVSGIDAPNKRLFDISINGQLAIKAFDIYATAGGRERAVRVSAFLSPAPEAVVVTFGKVRRKNKPAISGVMVYNVTVHDGSTTASVTSSSSASEQHSSSDSNVASTFSTVQSTSAGSSTIAQSRFVPHFVRITWSNRELL
jgi:hypothetical protein